MTQRPRALGSLGRAPDRVQLLDRGVETQCPGNERDARPRPGRTPRAMRPPPSSPPPPPPLAAARRLRFGHSPSQRSQPARSSTRAMSALRTLLNPSRRRSGSARRARAAASTAPAPFARFLRERDRRARRRASRPHRSPPCGAPRASASVFSPRVFAFRRSRRGRSIRAMTSGWS